MPLFDKSHFIIKNVTPPCAYIFFHGFMHQQHQQLVQTSTTSVFDLLCQGFSLHFFVVVEIKNGKVHKNSLYCAFPILSQNIPWFPSFHRTMCNTFLSTFFLSNKTKQTSYALHVLFLPAWRVKGENKGFAKHTFTHLICMHICMQSYVGTAKMGRMRISLYIHFSLLRNFLFSHFFPSRHNIMIVIIMHYCYYHHHHPRRHYYYYYHRKPYCASSACRRRRVYYLGILSHILNAQCILYSEIHSAHSHSFYL